MKNRKDIPYARSVILSLLTVFVSFAPSAAHYTGPYGAEVRAEGGRDAGFDAGAADSFILERVKATAIVGLSVAVMENGEIVYTRAFGKSCLVPERTAEPNTMFAIGSVTKQFTASCILLLQEEGKLSVNDKVSKYYPDLTDADEITLLDLMSMQSGYPDYYPLDFVDRRMARPIAADKLIHDYASIKLDFPPRTRWSYSNTGYIILGRVIEKLSGRPFGEFVGSRIFKPLGMEHTVYQPADSEKGLARGYTSFALGPPEPAVPEARGWASTAGAIYSTPSDLLKWDRALIDGKVLKPESYKLMTTSRLLADGRDPHYGCGQSIREANGAKILTHGGAVSGFIANNTLVPSNRSAVVVLTNCEASDGAADVNRKLIFMVLPKPPTAPEEKKKGAPDAPPEPPKISGPPAIEAATAFLRQLQAGKVDRASLGAEYSLFLTPSKVLGAQERLQAYGEPGGSSLDGRAERGGMEVAVVRFTFKGLTVRALMYRTPDGKIQEYLIQKQPDR